MNMHNPTHPGAFIKLAYVAPFNLSVRALAAALHVAPSTINRLLNEQGAVSPEMAHRLSHVLGRSPESWLAMQAQHDLWAASKKLKIGQLTPIDFDKLQDAA